jgi:hypothetical protein
MHDQESNEKNSLLYWYPKLAKLNIPMPTTIWYEIPKVLIRAMQEVNGVPTALFEKVKPIAREIGYPLFMKTDQAAGKHAWDASCYVPCEEVLGRHIFEVIESNMMADIIGLQFKALVFRNYIPLYSKFVAFHGNMPIAKERRYFVRDGKMVCHHAYWWPGAIEDWADRRKETKLPSNWRELLKELNTEDEEEIKLLTGYAELAGSVLDGWWSIDFACAQTGDWFLIDCALGADSFHALDCPNCPEEIRKAYEPQEQIDFSKILKTVDYKEPTHVAGITVGCPHCHKQLHLEFKKPMKQEKAAKLITKVEKIFTFAEVQKEFDEKKKKKEMKDKNGGDKK